MSGPDRPRIRARGWVLALVLAAGLGLPGRAEEPVAPEPPRIRRIVFPGAEQLSERALRRGMRLKAKTWWLPFRRNFYYGPDHLERDLDRVLLRYHEAGFPMARFTEARVRYLTRDWVDLEIRVQEGPAMRVASVTVHGAGEALGRRIAQRLLTRPRDPVREVSLQAEEERLRQTCAEYGYALADVKREMRFRGDSAEVHYWVDPGPLARVGRVRVEGLERTRPGVVRREVRLSPGDLLRSSKVRGVQERLFDLGLFRTVRITPAFCDTCPHRADELAVDLVVSLAEKKPGWYGFGLGFSSSDQFRLVGEWGYRNLLGRARALQVGALVAYPVGAARQEVGAGVKERQVDLTYTEPWLLGSPLRGQARGYYRFNREVSLEEDIAGASLRVRRDIGRAAGLIASIENKWIRTTDSTVARPRYQTRFVSLALAEDRRDFPLDPRSGQLNQVLAEYSGGFLGGAASFLRWTASHAAYLPLPQGVTAAYRVRAGYIRPVGRGVAQAGAARELLRVPFDERFRAGGGTSVRGHAAKSLGPSADGQPLGGLAMLVANAELRLPLVWQLGAAVFLDAGNVWESYQQLRPLRWTHGLRSATYSELDVNYSAGAGIRLRTPVGPLRLDYGVNLNRALAPGASRGEWHFSLGQAF